ncbi:MAG: c-type cytochrome [Candidatus Korobacteraceae bacterium]
MNQTVASWLISLTVAIATATLTVMAFAQGFHSAPSSATQMKNPYSRDASAAADGKKLYAQNCAQCHGNNLQGMGPAPTLVSASVKNAKPGELFWFVTTGDLSKGMPSWSQLSKQQRWQVVTFLESRNESK